MSEGAYLRRHSVLQAVLLLHIVAIGVYGAVVGPSHIFVELVPLIALFMVSWSRLSMRVRATATALGLYACSAVIVHLAGGMTEAHFHFFFVLALVSLYRDLLPYLVGIAFVLVEHFVVGILAPTAVFSHDGDALLWALVHAGFVAVTSLAHVASWRTVERAHREERGALTAELKRLAAVVDSAGIAIYSEDLDGRVRSWNDAAQALFGYEAPEIVGRSSSVLMTMEFSGELDEDLACVRAGEARAYETLRTTKSGSVLEVSLVVSPVRQDDGTVVGASIMARDIRRRRALERHLAAQQEELACKAEELRQLAFRDPLTGLCNRAAFLERLRTAHAAFAVPTWVVMLDLDGFKQVNDSAGHAAGDQLLEQVAVRLAGCVRSDDVVARLGGDEFALLLTETADPALVVDRILQELAAPHEIQGRWFTATASIGTALCRDYSSPAEVLRSADVALYAAKAAGKNRSLVYDAEMSKAVLRRAELTIDLRSALDQDDFLLHYQAIVDTVTGEIDGFEALLRWEHPAHGLISPAEFIPIAEQTGLILPAGTWVLQQATAEAARLTRVAQRPVSVSVNVSVHQLEDPQFVAVVSAALTAAGLPPRQLVIEVTESALADSAAVAVTTLCNVRAIGVAVAIDDFGTGYSSLDRLRTLPVDQLKIDRSFITEIDSAPLRSPSDAPAVQTPVLAAIIAMAAALDLQIVAEGVETERQFLALRQMGCQLAQGFFLHRPSAGTHAEDLLQQPFLFSGSSPGLRVDEELNSVMHLIRAAFESSDRDREFLPRLLEAACTVTGLDTAFFASVDVAAGTQSVVCTHGTGVPLVRAGEVFSWEQSVCKAALALGEWDSADAPVDYPNTAAAEAGVSSYCGAPIFGRTGTIVATLCAVDSSHRGSNSRGQEFLAFIAQVITDRIVAPEDPNSQLLFLRDTASISTP